jgi:hypothetical protein
MKTLSTENLSLRVYLAHAVTVKQEQNMIPLMDAIKHLNMPVYIITYLLQHENYRLHDRDPHVVSYSKLLSSGKPE